jgi:DNA-binding beta-propeller fold protein YncE
VHRSSIGFGVFTAGAALVLAFVAWQPGKGRAASTVDYAIAHSVALGGEGGWDYLTYDPTWHHLFISRATRVMVVDPSTGATSAPIRETAGVHGIALAQDIGKGFTSNGRDASVTVFDLVSLKTTAKIAIAGQNPDAILYDPATKRIFTFNGRSNDATAIDAQTNAIAGNISLPGKPEFAASGQDGKIYVNIEDKSELVAIDARSLSVLHTWPLAPCESPSGLSIDAVHQRLFVGCHNKLMAIVNAQSGAVIATLPIGEGVDATAFDPGPQLAFSSNGDGTLTIVHEDSPNRFSVVQTVTTLPNARTLAVDPSTHSVYLVTAKFTPGPPTAGESRPTRAIVPGSFTLLIVSPT